MVTLVVPFIGWLFGIAMVLISKAWSNREKTIGTALALLAVVPFSLAIGVKLEQHVRDLVLRVVGHRRTAERSLPGSALRQDRRGGGEAEGQSRREKGRRGGE